MINSKEKILKEIKSGKVKMRPRWKFVAERLGLNSVVILTIIISAIGISGVIIFADLYDPIELTSYGEVGWQLLKEDFPYWWGGTAIILALTGWMITPKLGTNYKKSQTYWLVIILIVLTWLTLMAMWLRGLLKL